MNFDFLFKPFEELDSLITGLFDGAPLLVALGDRLPARAAPRVGPRSPRRGDVAGGRRGRRHPQGRPAGRVVGRRACRARWW